MKLVRALRSGKYKQGEAALRREEDDYDEFCCLGVACTISEIPLKWEKDAWGEYEFEDLNGVTMNTSTLPREVVEEYSFYSANGSRRDHNDLLINNDLYSNLAVSNGS